MLTRDQYCGRTLEKYLADLAKNFMDKARRCLLRVWEGPADIMRSGLFLKKNSVGESRDRSPVCLCRVLIDIFDYCNFNFWALAW